MVDSSIVPINSATAPRYHYYTVDIATNKVIGEIPFEDVSYERALKQAGAFEGKITVTEQTNDLDLYNSTMPGRTALYVVRDKVAVWGGIIWGRTYDLNGRSLQVSASEFTSYLSHRLIWKTYSNSYTANLYKATPTSPVLVAIQSGTLKEPLTAFDDFGNPTKVEVSFVDSRYRKFTGYYNVLSTTTTPTADQDPSISTFYVSIPKLPVPTSGVYNNVTITARVDSYDYLRNLMNNVFDDFISLSFPNEVIEPGISQNVIPYTKQLSITNSTYGVATIVCKTDHNLFKGQRVELNNVDRMLDGTHTITEVPTPNSFKFVVSNKTQSVDRSVPIFLDDSLTTPALCDLDIERTPVHSRQQTEYISELITHIQRINGEVTLTLYSPHQFELGTKISLTTLNKKPFMFMVYNKEKKKNINTNTFMYPGDLKVQITSVTEDTISYIDPIYTESKYNVALTALPSADLGKNSVKSSEARVLMTLYTDNSHGFNIDDKVSVVGVDDPTWDFPRYNGRQTVFEVNAGKPHTIKKYEVVSDDVYDTVIKFYVVKKNNDNFRCLVEDNFLVEGFDGVLSYLNDNYTAISTATVSDDGLYWVVSADGPTGVVALTTLTDNPTLSVNGTKWIQYIPKYSEIRNAVGRKEPGTTMNGIRFQYVPASGKSTNKVIITTAQRHRLSVGDKVKVVFAGDTDNKTYGGIFTVTAVNDADRFTYSLRTSKNGKAIALPKEPTTQDKNITVTRTKTNVSINNKNGALAWARIKSVATADNGETKTAIVYAPNHNFAEGETIKVNFDGNRFLDLANNDEPITILEVPNENTFTYTTEGTLGKSLKDFPISEVHFGIPAAIAGETDPTPTANAIYYRVKGQSVNVTQNAVTVNAVSFTQHGYAARATVTFDQDVSNLIKVGATVQFANFPFSAGQSITPVPFSPEVEKIAYTPTSYSAGIVTVTCAVPHELDAVADIGATFMWDAAPIFSGPNLIGVDKAYFNLEVNKQFKISRVIDRWTFQYERFMGIKAFTANNVNDLQSPRSSVNPLLNSISYNAELSQMTLQFDGAHELQQYLDAGTARITISGFASSVSGINNSTGSTLSTSWVNGSFKVYSVPNTTSVVVWLSAAGAPANSVNIYNIGSAASSPTSTPYTVGCTGMSYSAASSALTFTFSSTLPFTPNSNTTMTLNSRKSSAIWPYETDRAPSPPVPGNIGVNLGAIALGSKTIISASRTSVTVSQGGYSVNWTVFGSGATPTSITMTNNLPGAAGVARPTVTTFPDNSNATTAFDSFIAYNPRFVVDPSSPDLSIYNKDTKIVTTVSGNAITFLDYYHLKDPAFSSGFTRNLSSLSPKAQVFAKAQVFNDVTAPVMGSGDLISIAGLQGDYSFLNDFNLTVLDYWAGADSGGVPTGYIKIANKYFTNSRKTMPPSKLSGLPADARAFKAIPVPGTAYVLPSTRNEAVEITHIKRESDGITAVITAPGHPFIVDDEIYLSIYDLDYMSFSQNYQRIKVTAVDGDTFTYKMAAPTRLVRYYGEAGVPDFGMYGTNTLVFGGNGAHNLCAGDTVTISGVSALTNGSRTVNTSIPNGFSILTEEVENFSARTTQTGQVTVTDYEPIDVDASGYVIYAPTIIKRPEVVYRTYGEFPGSANIGGLTYSTNEYSSKQIPNEPLYGSQLFTVAEILDKYSNNLDGFDYRIDVSLVQNADGSKSFNRQFVLSPIYPASLTEYLNTLPNGKLARGQVAHPKAFGADRIVFEYPGNISNVSMSENAENSATRVFVSGNNSEAGSGAEVAYSAASETRLLADGWPLLDKKENVEWPITQNPSAYVDEMDNYDDEIGFYRAAERFLAESKPPVGDFVISVNGSLNPVIGSYNPGDWCSIIINDNFVKNRLNSVLEPRKDVIVRKIDSIKVNVPNNPAFPEQIDLQLVTDWQVDRIGE